MSYVSNRVSAFNADTKQFELVTEAGVIDTPWDMEFITENLALVSCNFKQRVNIIDGEGSDRGVFALITNPFGILLPHLNLVAIASFSPTFRGYSSSTLTTTRAPRSKRVTRPPPSAPTRWEQACLNTSPSASYPTRS